MTIYQYGIYSLHFYAFLLEERNKCSVDIFDSIFSLLHQLPVYCVAYAAIHVDTVIFIILKVRLIAFIQGLLHDYDYTYIKYDACVLV